MDLISFEDLVVQPYNSYFTLEKELQEVKSQLSLMEQRLKYLEEKKPKKKRHVNHEDTDVEQYEIIEKRIQNDYDRKQRLINRNKKREDNEELKLKRKEEREEENEHRKKIQEEEIKKAENKKYWDSRREYWIKKNQNSSRNMCEYFKKLEDEDSDEEVQDKIVNTVCLDGDILADNIIFEPNGLKDHLYKYNLIKKIIINVSDINIRPYNNLLRCILNIILVEKIIIYAKHDYRLTKLIDNIIKGNFKFNIIVIKIGYSIGHMFPLSSISTRDNIENLKSYCNKNKIVLKIC